MQDVMIDLETWGTRTDAVIVQFGACYFERDTGTIGETMIINIDAEDSLRRGFKVDGPTLYFWMQQSDDARRSIYEGQRHKVGLALQDINEFLAGAKRIWSHATFDFVILMEHFRKMQMKPKFHWKAAKDIRTLTHLVPIKRVERSNQLTHHNALDDCVFQVQYCYECFKELNRRYVNG